MINFNDKTKAITTALRESAFAVYFESDGAARKKHDLLGVGIIARGNSEQYVFPCYNDLEFDLNPVIIREGRLIVTKEIIGKGNSKGLKWFETETDLGKVNMFMAQPDDVEGAEYTARPIVEPPKPPAAEGEAVPAAAPTAVAAPAAAPAAEAPKEGEKPADEAKS